MPTEKPKTKKSAKPKNSYIYSLGRRRTASARVRIYLKPSAEQKGKIQINKKAVEQYFPGMINSKKYLEPLRIANVLDKYYISARIVGSGVSSQLDAFVHGLSRALVLLDEEKFREVLKKKGFLTRDARKRETRKAGTGGKARRQKQSPKR